MNGDGVGKLEALRREMHGKSRENVHAYPQSSAKASNYPSDIENFQSSIRSLADAMHEELRMIRAESHRFKTDRETWLMTMRALKEDVSDKVVQMELEKTRVVSELTSIKASLKEDVARALSASEEKQRVLEKQVHDLRVEVRGLKNTVENARVLGSNDFPQSVIDQRLKDKEGILAMLSESVKEVAPLAIYTAVKSQAPAFVKECFGEELRQVVEMKGEVMRREMREREERMDAIISRTSVEAAEALGEIQALQQRCQVRNSRDITLTLWPNLDVDVIQSTILTFPFCS